MERTPNNDGINASYVDIPNSTAVDHLVSIIYAPGYATKRRDNFHNRKYKPARTTAKTATFQPPV
jgi:hypothetical protein